MLALPVNQTCLFASVDNAPPGTRDIKNIKVNSFPGSSIFFSSVIQICDSECDQITSATESSRMESVCKYVSITSNVLKYYFKFLLMSILCTDNFMTVFLYHNFQFFSDIIKTWLHYAQKKTCAARTAKGFLYNGKKNCSQKSQFWSNFFCLLQLRMVLLNAPAQL